MTYNNISVKLDWEGEHRFGADDLYLEGKWVLAVVKDNCSWLGSGMSVSRTAGPVVH